MIEFRGVNYRYPNGIAALKGVNLKIGDGVTAVVGPNGSGKTTLALHMNGILKPTSGNVIVNGLDTKRASPSELSRTVGYVFQNPRRMFFEETVLREAAFGPANLGLSMEEVIRRAREALNAVGLRNYEGRSPFSLSGGEQKRLAIASVLAMDPQYIVIDEPMAGLDLRGRLEVVETIKKLSKSGRGVVILTHDMDLVMELAGRVILLEDGRVNFDGHINEFLKLDMEEHGLRTPDVVRISRELGIGPVKTVRELIDVLGEGKWVRYGKSTR